MEKRKDFTGIDPAVHRLAKVQASSEGRSLKNYLARLILEDSKKGEKK